MSATARASLRGLRTFCLAARYLSFRAASEELFVTASAVSHQIKNLEEELGLELFDRSGRDLTLTDAGQQLYAEIRPLIEEIDDIVSRHKHGGSRSSVRVSVQPFFGSEYFVPRLTDFTAKQPDIDIQVSASDEAPEKHPADADLSIRLFRKPPANVASRKLFPLRLVPGASPAFARGVRADKGRIVGDFPLILHTILPRAWEQWSADAGVALPAAPKITRLDSMIGVLRAAERGIGAALVPMPMGELWFREGRIERLFEHELVTDHAYYLTWKEAPVESAQARLLKDWIIETFVSDA